MKELLSLLNHIEYPYSSFPQYGHGFSNHYSGSYGSKSAVDELLDLYKYGYIPFRLYGQVSVWF